MANEIKANDENVRTVYLFGSVNRGDPSSLDFDIDLALDGGDVYLAMDITDKSEFKVDIVSLPLLPLLLRERIITTGLAL